MSHALPLAALAALLALLAAPPARPAPPEEPAAATPIEDAVFELNGLLVVRSIPRAAVGRPVPAVIIISAEEHSNRHADLYAEQLLGAGLATLVLTPELDQRVTLAEAVRQVVQDPRLDPAHVGVLGFGEGALVALRSPLPFAARAMLYPGCGALLDRTLPALLLEDTTLLLVHGASDPANSPEDCRAATAALAGFGARIRRVEYAHAGYAFDMPAYGSSSGRGRLFAPGLPTRVEVQVWPELAAMAASQVAGFFAAALKPPRP